MQKKRFLSFGRGVEHETAHSLRLGKFLDTLKASGFFMLLVLIAEALHKRNYDTR